MTLSVRCPTCKAVHRVGDEMAGQRAKCKCGAIMMIPARKPSPTQPQAAAGQSAPAAAPLVVRCPSCGKIHRVKASMAGTAARCPCGAVMQIPRSPQATPAAAAASGTGPLVPAQSSIWDELNDDQWAAIEAGRKVDKPQEGDDDASPAKNLFGGVAATNGLWADRKHLVASSSARFPSRCVKSNEPTDNRVQTNFSWCPPWIIVLLFICNLLVYLIVAAIMTRRIRLEYGLHQRLVTKRYIHIAIGVGILLSSIIFFAMAAAALGGADRGDPSIAGIVLMIIGFMMLPAGAMYSMYVGRAVAPVYIDSNKEHVWLKGAHPDFLATLPLWDGPPRGT